MILLWQGTTHRLVTEASYMWSGPGLWIRVISAGSDSYFWVPLHSVLPTLAPLYQISAWSLQAFSIRAYNVERMMGMKAGLCTLHGNACTLYGLYQSTYLATASLNPNISHTLFGTNLRYNVPSISLRNHLHILYLFITARAV